MTVLDSSGVVDVLERTGAADQVTKLLQAGPCAAPDVVVFEVLAVLRRDVARGLMTPERGDGAVRDLGDVSLELFSSLALRHRAWQLRDNMTAADALFVALAGQLDEPLATKDERLAAAVDAHTSVDVLPLWPP